MRYLALIALIAGCNRPTPPAANAPVAVAIAVIKPEKKALERFVEQPGTVQAFEETVLHAKLAGFVDKVFDDPAKQKNTGPDKLIDIGSIVVKEQELALLKIPELDADKAAKAALIKQAEAEIVQAEKGLAAATAAVTSARAFQDEMQAAVAKAQSLLDRWQSEMLRVGGLVKSGVADQQVEDETKNQLKAAEANRNEMAARVVSAAAAVEKAKADEAKAVADVNAVKARKEVVMAEAARVEALLKYTVIRAPFDGIISKRNVNDVDFVGGGEKTGLFTVTRMKPVRAVVQVPEADAAAVAAERPVKLSIGGREIATMVSRTSWTLSPGSRSLRVEIDLANEDLAYRPGAYVQAKFTVKLPEAWAVPAAAIGKYNDEAVVFLVTDGKAVRAPVQLLKGTAQFTQLRAYKRGGEWIEFTGEEKLASPAAAVSDGQEIK